MPDDRAAGLDRQVHDLGDLLAVHLAQRAAEDREVLGEHAHLAAVDRAVAGDHAVAVRAVLLQAEGGGAVPCQRRADERALVEEHLDPLAGGPAALGVLLLDRLGGAACRVRPRAGRDRRVARRRPDVDVLRDLGSLAGMDTHGHGSSLALEMWTVGQSTPVTAAPMRRPSLDAAELSGLAPDLAVEVVESVPSTNAVATEGARGGP